MMTPPRRMPADTQIATRVRGGNVCGLESVEAEDEGLVSNDYGQGKPNPFSKRERKKKRTDGSPVATAESPRSEMVVGMFMTVVPLSMPIGVTPVLPTVVVVWGCCWVWVGVWRGRMRG